MASIHQVGILLFKYTAAIACGLRDFYLRDEEGTHCDLPFPELSQPTAALTWTFIHSLRVRRGVEAERELDRLGYTLTYESMNVGARNRMPANNRGRIPQPRVGCHSANRFDQDSDHSLDVRAPHVANTYVLRVKSPSCAATHRDTGRAHAMVFDSPPSPPAQARIILAWVFSLLALTPILTSKRTNGYERMGPYHTPSRDSVVV